VSIEIYTEDNFLEPHLHRKAYSYAMNRGQAKWGEYDNDPSKPTGLTVNCTDTEPIYKKFDEVAREKFPIIKDFELVRLYINCFMPYEQPLFHVDADPKIDGLDAYTMLYYPQLEYDRQEGGWTEFLLDDDSYVHGSLPLSNRATLFNGKLWHRATPFRNHVRFTYALKYENITDPNLDLRKYGSARR
tara:strand:+ start:308 stop:871 length:564 start_codon:yes stop_codon:yes gene_type:complete